MMNTLFATTKNSKEKKFSFTDTQQKSISDKYFEYFKSEGYSDEESKLIANLYESSALNADCKNLNLAELKNQGELSLFCLNGDVELYCCPKGSNTNQCIAKLSLEVALVLASIAGIEWERGSRHFLETYWLA